MLPALSSREGIDLNVMQLCSYAVMRFVILKTAKLQNCKTKRTMSQITTNTKNEGAFFRKRILISMFIPGVFVFVMWLVKIIEILFNLDLSNLGIYPLAVKGLKGIIFPFIHSDFNHLFSNSSSLLSRTALFYFYNEIAIKVSVVLLSGYLYGWQAEMLAHRR
jgi:hypothetical protein